MYKKSKILRKIRKGLEEGKRLSEAQRDAGLRSSATLFHWRRRVMINNYIKKCLYKGEVSTIYKVEDAYIKKLISGEASGSEYAYFLSNRMPERYKPQSALVQNTVVNQNTNVKEEIVINVEQATEQLKGNLSILKRNGVDLN